MVCVDDRGIVTLPDEKSANLAAVVIDSFQGLADGAVELSDFHRLLFLQQCGGLVALQDLFNFQFGHSANHFRGVGDFGTGDAIHDEHVLEFA